MIYVPILKTRREEYSVIKDMSECFSERIIPMIEVISDKYKPRYKIDATTGEFVYKEQAKRRVKIKEIPTDEDVITLEHINTLMNGKKMFIDYFRFSNKVYGNNVNILSAQLSWKVSNDFELYKEKLRGISQYPNMIPVISVKPYFDIGKNEAMNLVIEMQDQYRAIALRITEEWIEKYEDILRNTLRNDDYILFDIGEQNPQTKFIEIEQIQEMESRAHLVLVNSPRKRENKNSEFPEYGRTDLIDNCAKDIAEEYQLDGYGDYCGLKDTMPLNSGSNGMGAALALFYEFESNSFISYSNHDITQGVRGYRTVVPRILKDSEKLDPQNNCPSVKKIREMDGYGGWPTWHNINAMRYIHQTYMYL